MNSLGFSKKDNYSRCMNSAINSLAMREHSRKEIYNKLRKKEFSENVDLYALLDKLEAKDYLNEQRFTESFIRYRAQRGQGLNKITNDLRQRGINSSLLNLALDTAEINWYQLASEQRIKKFGEKIPHDFKEKAKQMRFLSRRGFDSEIIRSLMW